MNLEAFYAAYRADGRSRPAYMRTSPSCRRQTQGQDLDEARSAVRDAVELVLEERRAGGEHIPATGWALVERLDVAA